MNEKVNVAVIYYSATGNVYQLARAIGEGAEQAGGEVRLRKVHELAPPEAIKSNLQWARAAEQTRDVPEASLDDLDWADVVLYENAHVVPNLGQVLEACRRVGAELLVDAYHALNVVPFSLRGERLEGAYVVGGGYKYCQLGEGNCFLRIPPDCALRPAVTGWFAEFATLTEPEGTGRVAYPAGAGRFAGATYDPTSHYRGARVFDFFDEHALTPDFLRRVSRHQVGLLILGFDALDADPRTIGRERLVPLDQIGGFLALRSRHAATLSRRLRDGGVHTDYRGNVLRLGPAPYLSDAQLTAAIDALGDAGRSLR